MYTIYKMLISFLAYSNTILFYTTYFLKELKHAIVDFLGNNPTNYYLLEDGRVLPDSIQLPDYERVTAYMYNSNTNTISKANNLTPEGRFKPLPYLSITVQNDHVPRTDISDWVGEVRANPIPRNINVKQIIALWSLVNRRYTPTGEGLVIHVVDSDANETVIH